MKHDTDWIGMQAAIIYFLLDHCWLDWIVQLRLKEFCRSFIWLNLDEFLLVLFFFIELLLFLLEEYILQILSFKPKTTRQHCSRAVCNLWPQSAHWYTDSNNKQQHIAHRSNILPKYRQRPMSWYFAPYCGPRGNFYFISLQTR